MNNPSETLCLQSSQSGEETATVEGEPKPRTSRLWCPQCDADMPIGQGAWSCSNCGAALFPVDHYVSCASLEQILLAACRAGLRDLTVPQHQQSHITVPLLRAAVVRAVAEGKEGQ